MAKIIQKLLIIILLAILLSINITVYADPPVKSPAPSPQIPPPSPVLETNPSPASSPAPNPSPADENTTSTPTPTVSPAPVPAGVSDGGLKEDVKAGGEEKESGGMSGGKKAGIALGVIGAVCVAGVGGFVYKKRQHNLRRSEYSYGARREIL